MNEIGPAPDPLSRWTYPTLMGAAFWTLLALVAQVGLFAVAVGVWLAAGFDTESTAFQQGLSLMATASTALLAVAVCFLLFRGKALRVVGWRF